ncbi:hypothetical protein AQ490_13095 [Wenjunlia vitaminophila]|uniref:Uncharacterized protein n=1 Tax=Wenjunlia vitaminophila TaxID=76728 RepID=A0A0T6LXJ3_WENVI|nr:hypothetical protein [Wenjunlia vitaminophila]KRV50883.1 hypothetical protein AQ490_13095 [Wenjunlia vitaminophila]
MVDVAPALPAPTGYTVVIPPGWSRIPLRSGTDEAVKKIVDEAVEQLPDDVPKDKLSLLRMDLIKRLRKASREAKSNSGLDLYLPVETMHGVFVAASFIVSEFRYESVTEIDPSMVAARLLSTSEGAEPTTLDGAIGMRVERVAEPSEKRGVEYASRRVDYVVNVPEDPNRWVSVGFSTVADGEPRSEFADVLVELFDAIMTTFRWSHP